MSVHPSFSWKSWSLGALCGAAAVVLVGAAQPNNAQATGRYQITAWARPAAQGLDTAGSFGAYRIDTQTGEMDAIDMNGIVRPIQAR
ncbi:MAG TPA: hypothetical protein VH518_16930 [Tepidisphaeraceae bacterium]|jgi:hypothetical protein